MYANAIVFLDLIMVAKLENKREKGKLEGGIKPPRFKSFLSTPILFLKWLLLQNLGGYLLQ
ncbi:MAG: hypothetical protein DWQ02_20250 [Bacteroidetes bacterium]|nr:MAG: hypothetical protein DWQ02_20250 [Bacteroidota bacterium]